jgi:hypothetical protein
VRDFRNFLEKRGDIALTMVASGLLLIPLPLLGWLPLIAIGAAIGAAAYLTDDTRRK